MLLQQKPSFCFNLLLAHFVLCTLLLFKRIYQGFDLFLQTSFLPSTLFNFQDPIASLKLPLDSAFIVYHIRSRLSSPFFRTLSTPARFVAFLFYHLQSFLSIPFFHPPGSFFSIASASRPCPPGQLVYTTISLPLLSTFSHSFSSFAYKQLYFQYYSIYSNSLLFLSFYFLYWYNFSIIVKSITILYLD